MDRDTIVGEYYAKEFDNLVRRLSRGAGSVSNAEDVVQEAFSRALKYFHSFDPTKKSFQTWFSVILVNAYNAFRNEELRGGAVVELDEEMVGQEDLPHYEGNLLDKVKELIEKKSPYEAEVLDLYFIQGLKPREIVEVTDVKLRTAESYIYQFKIYLREVMN